MAIITLSYDLVVDPHFAHSVVRVARHCHTAVFRNRLRLSTDVGPATVEVGTWDHLVPLLIIHESTECIVIVLFAPVIEAWS